MTTTNPSAGADHLAGRSNWVRMRTLTLLRWMAIAGQTGAILAARFVFDIKISVAPCLLLVALSALVNLISRVRFPENRRLSEHEALAVLIYDCCQLAALLYMTGGLNNPFAILLLAPATIAATALKTRATAIVTGLTVALASILARHHLPLLHADGSEIKVPGLFGFGFWLALVIGVLFLALYARRVSGELHAMSEALLATQMALAREQKLTDLSGVVAAAAHELGTPLATIKLASSELADELDDRPDLRADAELIRAQAGRCSEILRSMGRSGKDDLQMRAAPLLAIIEEAAEPHGDRGKKISFDLGGRELAGQPLLQRRPEIIHGLRNLIQNAVDFARTNVTITLGWAAGELSVRIADDGPGFPPNRIGRLGDPFLRPRGAMPAPDLTRPQYEGMGLGLFIAKTLLERTGARLRFENGGTAGSAEGAIVTVTWPRRAVEAPAGFAVGENLAIER